MRLFTGIALSEEIVQNLESLIRRLQPAARIKWGRAKNLHITTKFIGEWPTERLEELRAALGELPPRDAIPIAVRGLGWFPNPRAPRIFWAGIEAPLDLVLLAQNTDQRLGHLGVERKRRKFSPHLTLARTRNPAPLNELTRAIETLPSTEFGSFTADRFHLYLSELTPSGAVYTTLNEFPLRGK